MRSRLWFVPLLMVGLALGTASQAAAQAAKPQPAATQAATAKPADKSRGNEAPIEITANELTVRQQENLAIFRGDVDAVQGQTSLKADELRVFYVGDEGGPPGANNDIRRIEADGNVLLAQPDQSAAGDHGIYDVPNAKVTLTGNVVLSNPTNVVRGTHLDYDLDTGVATVSAPGSAGQRGQRVRAVFQGQSVQPSGQKGQR